MRLACRALIFHLIAVSAVPIPCYAADNAATQALHQLFDREWEYQVNIWIEKKRAQGRKSAQAPKQDNPHV